MTLQIIAVGALVVNVEAACVCGKSDWMSQVHVRGMQCCYAACLTDLHGCRKILTVLWGVGQGAPLADEEEQEKSRGGCQVWLTAPATHNLNLL